MLIHEINEEERPREKAWRYGVESLSDAELLAILVRNGYKGKSSLQIASEILRLYPLPQLPYLEINNLTEIKGIKEIKALELLANFELVRRISEREVIKRDVVSNQTVLLEWVRKEIGYAQQEHFIAIYLSIKNHIIAYKKLFSGTLNTSVVHPREIFKWAVYYSAAKIICVHNHPSMDCSPSKQDIALTELLVEAGEMMGIPIVDHLIVSGKSYRSILHQQHQSD